MSDARNLLDGTAGLAALYQVIEAKSHWVFIRCLPATEPEDLADLIIAVGDDLPENGKDCLVVITPTPDWLRLITGVAWLLGVAVPRRCYTLTELVGMLGADTYQEEQLAAGNVCLLGRASDVIPAVLARAVAEMFLGRVYAAGQAESRGSPT